MAPTLESLGIDRLSIDDRISLVTAIWDSVAKETPDVLHENQRQELARRIAEHDANPDDVIPWEEIREQALKRFQR